MAVNEHMPDTCRQRKAAMNEPHQCMVNGCDNPPAKYVEADAGLEGSLRFYYCEEHAADEAAGKTLDMEASRAEPETESALEP